MVILLPLMAAAAARGQNRAAPQPPKPIQAPYPLERLLSRGEELFAQDNYREAAIFYYEALQARPGAELAGRLHFRLGECLEAVRRFEFAAYHYKLALKSPLSETLAARALTKLEHLPVLAQREEATRLFERARRHHRQKNVRAALDDYLESIRLDPSLMSQDDGNLIEDAIQYLTYLSESPTEEPKRLLKLATFLELRGEAEKAREVYKQIQVLFRGTPEARQARDKVAFFEERRNRFIEFRAPENALEQVVPAAPTHLVDTAFEFTDPGTISKEADGVAYTFRASNSLPNLPPRRFENFTIILGRGGDQREFLLRAVDGEPEERELTHDDGQVVYQVRLDVVEIVTTYVNDVYGDGLRSQPLFARIKIQLTARRR